jgi:FAD/FMN-containing dehydrogenase
MIAQTDDQKQADQWWRARGRLLALFAAQKNSAVLATVLMPEHHINYFLTEMNRISQEASMASTFYGHLGENRWHLIVQPVQHEEDARERLSAVVRRLQDFSASLHGQFLRPYALGFLPTGSLVSPEDSGQGRLWRILKTRFDPLDIFRQME